MYKISISINSHRDEVLTSFFQAKKILLKNKELNPSVQSYERGFDIFRSPLQTTSKKKLIPYIIIEKQ